MLILSSCENIKDQLGSSKKIKEGFIEYSMEYLNEEEINMANLLPHKMVIKFKDNNTINKIESFSGVVSFKSITRNDDKTNTTLVKLLNKKFLYQEPIGENSFSYDYIPGMKLEFTDSTKEIAGYLCQHAIATFPNSNNPGFDIFYTKEINIESPNAFTPFEEIDGVMLQFEVVMYNFKVRFTADHIQATKIANEEFEIPADYKKVNKESMEEIINLFS